MRGATVVLSGCQTGEGRLEGGEVLGLISAFLYAGARGVVSTLWKVDDAVTPLLMSDFYRGLANGLDTVEALREAQLHSLKNKFYAAPDIWGAFQFTGASSDFFS
jgi:CHAT domain-containing protein